MSADSAGGPTGPVGRDVGEGGHAADGTPAASGPVERLDAPTPGWSVEADVVVVGSGVAGLTTALRCAAAGRRTVVVTKARLDDGSTRWAQGGVAAALGAGDSPQQHLDDTLLAGAGLCAEDAVRTLVTEGPDAVRRLIETGASFDRTEGGEIALTREGGHRRRRIAHAGGDATGAEISRALLSAVLSGREHTLGPHAAPLDTVASPSLLPGAEAYGAEADGRTVGNPLVTIENALVLDLLTTEDGTTAGVTLHVMGEGQHDGVGAVRAPAVVLATGGMGQVFSATTNPAVSTGDGVALALRAGAELSDLEFVQFHPTVLYLGPDSTGQQPLISEAVRGEGARLVDADGVPFMRGEHELADLAPRDVVAKAIMRRAAQQGTRHMYLDARHFGSEMWESRFPTILEACRAHGVDPVAELVPVAPAAHYASGGVRTDLLGRTTVPGLYACGEVSCTGVHGANRLASNSLLEGLVFAERIAAHLTGPAGDDGTADPDPAGDTAPSAPPAPGRSSEPSRGTPPTPPTVAPLLPPEARPVIQRIMTEGAGVLRSAASLAEAAAGLDALAAEAADRRRPRQRSEDAGHDAAGKTGQPGVESWETTNLHLVARALVAAAQRRTETRGCHWREDHPGRDDVRWSRHLVLSLLPEGARSSPHPEGASAGAAPAEEAPHHGDSRPTVPAPRDSHRAGSAARGPARNLDVRTTETTGFPPVVNKEKL